MLFYCRKQAESLSRCIDQLLKKWMYSKQIFLFFFNYVSRSICILRFCCVGSDTVGSVMPSQFTDSCGFIFIINQIQQFLMHRMQLCIQHRSVCDSARRPVSVRQRTAASIYSYQSAIPVILDLSETKFRSIVECSRGSSCSYAGWGRYTVAVVYSSDYCISVGSVPAFFGWS